MGQSATLCVIDLNPLLMAMTTRLDGTLTHWNDERGFGFISPAEGGADVFVHISAFRGERPRQDQRVKFVLEPGTSAKPRAAQVDVISPPGLGLLKASGMRPWSLLLLACFVLLMAAGLDLGDLSWWVAVLYGLASVVAFMAYAADKNAARAGMRRTPENTLHLLSLMGGWPGALVAQQVFRHKTAKTSFRIVYWLTVLLNLGACLLLALPAQRAWLWQWLLQRLA